MTRGELGAWVVKANPALWDVHAARLAGEPLDRWRLTESYRLDLVQPGDRLVVWATRGPAGADVGFLAEATVAGPLELDVGGSDWTRAVDREAVRPHVPLAHTRWWPEAVTIEDCRTDPVLRHIEVLRAPRVGNPSWLTVRQVAALDRSRRAG
ncbi:MAG: hypothetical protein R3249_11750 [Nitriliruptorales bacterium]|nr:hypothetical protein [Nitriliruptorales bacterium]